MGLENTVSSTSRLHHLHVALTPNPPPPLACAPPLRPSPSRPFQIKTGIKGNPVTGNVLTNREVLAALDANVNMLPYVYDTFKWDHCLEAGVNFDDAWGTGSNTAE